MYSVYFSVTFKKSKQKKVKQTTIRYKYDHLRSLVGIFFFWACRFLDVSMYGIWLASACAVSYAWKAIWLADTCFASRKVEHSSTLATSKAWNATQRNGTEPNGATIQFGKGWRHPIQSEWGSVNPDGSTHSNAKVWMLCNLPFTRTRSNALIRQGWHHPLPNWILAPWVPQALANQIAFMLTSKEAKKKKMVVFVPKSCLFDFFLLRFF